MRKSTIGKKRNCESYKLQKGQYFYLALLFFIDFLAEGLPIIRIIMSGFQEMVIPVGSKARRFLWVHGSLPLPIPMMQ